MKHVYVPTLCNRIIKFFSVLVPQIALVWKTTILPQIVKRYDWSLPISLKHCNCIAASDTVWFLILYLSPINILYPHMCLSISISEKSFSILYFRPHVLHLPCFTAETEPVTPLTKWNADCYIIFVAESQCKICFQLFNFQLCPPLLLIFLKNAHAFISVIYLWYHNVSTPPPPTVCHRLFDNLKTYSYICFLNVYLLLSHVEILIIH